MNYKDLNDYELLNYVAEGNEDANNLVIEKYQPLIKKYSIRMMNACQNCGLELSDLEQEGMIGLMYAIDTFNDQKEATFYTYAKTCIQNKIVSAVIASQRLKHKILNDSLSFDNDDINNNNLLKDEMNNPENIVIDLDAEDYIINTLKQQLTDKEDQVFQLMISGFNYKEIAHILDTNVKSVDNTIQRIRKKMKEILKNQN